MMTIATNCRMTRQRISCCERLLRAAAHHVDEAEQEDEHDRGERKRRQVFEEGGHDLSVLSPEPPPLASAI